MPDLPTPVRNVVDAINDGDLDAFVAAFAEDGHVDDWGRRLDGHDGIRSWGQSDAIGANATMDVQDATTAGDVTTVQAEWRSNVFNGTSTFIFATTGDKVHSLTIPPG